MGREGDGEGQFLEADLGTPLPRKSNFADPDEIRDLARRGGSLGYVRGKADVRVGY
jgi:hypothetical protein